MTPEEIRKKRDSSIEENDFWLAEIAAQLAELKQEIAVGLETLNQRLGDYFTIQVTEEMEKGKR